MAYFLKILDLINASKIKLRPVQKKDWAWISDWFRDPWLNKELGPIDREWLDHVLTETSGVELVAEIDRQPVGLIGITWGTSEHPFHAVTDLAIAPPLRKRGLGGRVLKAAMQWPGHPKKNQWVTFTAKDNDPPARLLISMGWVKQVNKAA